MRAVMRSLTFAALMGATALGLAGCGGNPPEPAKDETANAAPKAGEKARPKGPVEIRFDPGRWESTMKIEKLDLGNLPPQVRQVIEGELGKERKFDYCLTPEEAAKPDSKFFNRGESDDCTYDEYTMADGHLDIKMSCKVPQGTQKVTLTGTYSASNYSMTMSTSGDAAMGTPMLMTMSLASRRAGACRGDEGR